MGEAMADNDYTHTSEVLKAALPYMDAKTKPAMDLFINLNEFMTCIRSFRTKNVAACGFDNEKPDMEAMLSGIRPKCNDKEMAFIDKILGFLNAKRMYEMYNNYMSVMKNMPDFSGFNFNDSNSSFNIDNILNSFSGSDLSKVFKSDINPDDEASDNNGYSKDNTINNYDSSKNDYNSSDSHSANSNSVNGNSANSNSTNGNSANSNSTNSNSANGQGGNNAMLNMLKSMVPPEQQATFENLRMLLGTMSYDDNSKSDNDKE